MAMLVEIASWALLLGGSALMLIGGIGLCRLPDVYTRMHGAGIIDTLGAVMIIAGLMVQAGLTLITVKLALIIIFLFFTSPTTTHALARAALAEGVLPLIDDKDDDDIDLSLYGMDGVDLTEESDPSKT
ncbi:MAG: monovalent cation/H(+) antiporter subunit G [Alphaproteobacteria bacterium]